MNTSRICRLAGAATLIGMLGLAPPQAGASVVLNGCAGGSFGNNCGLDELIAGGTMVINDSLFANFTLTLFNGRLPDASVIRVDPLDPLLNPGFRLVDTANTLRAADGDGTESDFTFTVAALSGNVKIKDNSLVVAIGDVGGNGGTVNVFETLLNPTLTDVLGNKDVFCDAASCANGDGTDLAEFSPVTALQVFAGINAVSLVAGVAEINEITMQFSQIPEPGSLALLALGVAGIGASRRRIART